MSKKVKNEPAASSKLEVALGWVATVFIGVSVLAFLAVLIIAALQTTAGQPGGAYQILATVALFGLPIGFLALFALLLLNARKRSKHNRKR